MRVAIVHYWLLRMRGGEKVVEALCRMYPSADIFTLFYAPDEVSETIRSHQVRTSYLNPMRRWYRSLLPLMPMALEQFDLREYDLVISSESGPAKGVLTSASTLHVCYCHSPMRYLWEMYPEYRNEWTRSRWKRTLMTPLAHYLRLWDHASAARVDRFVANSANVRRRIEKVWRRESDIVHPPVAVDTFRHEAAEDYLLVVSELVPYKRIDAAVRVCSRLGRKLRIAGTGPEYGRLRKMAASCIEFCGHVPEAQLRDLYARCRAFLMPGEEDFGITVVEALASGKPVVAYDRGGAPEILKACPSPAGVLYGKGDDESLASALDQLAVTEKEVQAERLREAAQRFSEARFQKQMGDIVDSAFRQGPASSF